MRVLLVCRTPQGYGGTEKHIAWLKDALKTRNIHAEIFPISSIFQIPKLAWTMRGYHIVHFFLPRPYVYGSIAAILARHKCCVMSRRSLVEQYQTPLLRFIEKLLHRRTKAIIANSYAVFDQIITETEPAKCFVIRGGIDADTAQRRQYLSLQGPRRSALRAGSYQRPTARLEIVDSGPRRSAAI